MVHFHHVGENFLEVFVLRRPSHQRKYANRYTPDPEAALFDRHPHTVFVGRITCARFTELCAWIEQNCDSETVIHNFCEESAPWYTGFGFSDVVAATAFKLRWGVSRHLPGLGLE